MKNKIDNFELNKSNKFISIFSFFFIVLYFFYGFLTNENAAGAGGYNGDFNHIWNNLNLFKTGIFINLDNIEYTDSRFPFSYIFHIYLNPFIETKLGLRLSVFVLSALVPVLFFLCIRENYKKNNLETILLISSLILLSPYFRTSSYWGLGENYSLIFLCLSYLFFVNFKKNYILNTKLKNNLLILFVCFCSSLCVYFDQKFLIVPLVCYFSLLNLKIEKIYKLSATVYFIILSFPCLYLVYIWGAILPPDAANHRITKTIHLHNFGYSLSILAFYIFPFLLTKKMKFKNFLDVFFKKNNLITFLFFGVYLISLIFFDNFENLTILGKGIFHKLFLFVVTDSFYRLILTLITFFFSLIIILIYFEKKIDYLIISYFLLISLFIYPFMQEYLDPLILVLIFTFLKTKIKINYKNSFILTLFFTTFLLGTKVYYGIIL